MTEEEKKAIELIKQKSYDDLFYIQCGNSIDKSIETLLSLIEKQQKEINHYKSLYNTANATTDRQQKEIKTLTNTNKSYKGKLQEQGNDISRLQKEIKELKEKIEFYNKQIDIDYVEDNYIEKRVYKNKVKQYEDRIKQRDYTIEIYDKEINNLKSIEEEHRKENGKLREEIKQNVKDTMEIQDKLEKYINNKWKQKIQKKINFIQGLYNTHEEEIEIAYQQQWIVDTTALLEELLEEGE